MRAFYAPVGLTPYEISDIAEALAPLAGADGPDDAPEWKAAPPGLAPDLYLTHLRCVDLDDDGQQGADGPADTAIGFNRYIQRVALDPQGHYQGLPACLLGEDEEAHQEWRNSTDHAGEELAQNLTESFGGLDALRSRYALITAMVSQRASWGCHHLVWRDPASSALVAVVSASRRKVWRQQHLPLAAMRGATLSTIPYAEGWRFDASGMEELSFWELLWEYTLRCPLPQVHAMLPPRLWRYTVHAHRTYHLPDRVLSDPARHVLAQVQNGHRLRITDALTHPTLDTGELLRAVAGLLFTRVLAIDCRALNRKAPPRLFDPTTLHATDGMD